MLFNKIILIFLILCISINCKKKNKEKEVVEEDIDTVLKSALKWAEKNNIYINNKLIFNRKKEQDKYFYFSTQSRISEGTLLMKVPYNIMISQNSFNEIYKNSKNKKFANLWKNIYNSKNEYIKYPSTKQLLYMSVILESAIRKMKGPIYKKYKELLKLHDYFNIDIFPIFYDEQEKYYLGGSNFGAQIFRADNSLKEEYFLITNKFNLTIPYQDEFLKQRALSLISSIFFNNTNYNYTKEYNETVIVPFLDCFLKAISEDNSNAKIEINGIKNETTNFTDYFLEIYSSKDIVLGGEIHLKWNPFPNTELLLYYGMVEEGNKFKPKYYVDVFNRKLREELKVTDEKKFKNVEREMYELNKEFYEQSLINTYRNLSIYFDKYKNKEEGTYQMMLDNLKYYYDLYENPFSDGNINMFINGKDKIKNIKEIIHMEKKMVNEKIKHLEKVIKEIIRRNNESNNKEKNNKNKDDNKEEL